MTLYKIKPYSYILALLIFTGNCLFGFDKPIRIVASPALENNPPGFIINTNASQIVQLAAPGGSSYDKEVLGTVKVLIKTNATQYVAPYNAEITLEIKTYDVAGSLISNATNILLVNHQPFTNNAYKDQDYVIFNSQLPASRVYKIETKIIQIKINNVIVNSLPHNMLVESTIDYLRYDQFTYNAFVQAPQITPIDLSGDAIPDIYQVTWNPMTGARHYELEYATVNDYDISGGLNVNAQKAASSLNFDFKNNSTRIITFANTYTIPVVFDRGYFLCRVRGFGKDISGISPSLLPFNGNWSFNTNSGFVSTFISATAQYSGWTIVADHFEKLKNWQYNATFAEEGKHKDVINFADGSLRSRQTITKINSENVTIVGESVYDFTGRAAINILPVPIPNNASQTFLYKPNFNLTDVSNTKYSKNDFDLDDIGDPCNPNATGLSTTSGASKYYSPNNPNKNNQQAFVPDAQKFPFTQVEYTPDNTGRIKKQGGVGLDHQLGSTHETKYFYGSPEQIEIDRLFGSEVGDASHYQKNMVIDANGQVSLTYMDMEGKTIATSLAGSAPPNMLNMPKQPLTTTNLTADMFNKDANGISQNNIVDPNGESITFNKSILITDGNTPVVFDYSLSVNSFIDCQQAPNLCFHCVYDFEFKIVDDCGLLIYSTAQTGNLGKKILGQFTIVNGNPVFNTTCVNNPFSYQEVTNSPPLTLQAGVYYVSKILKINTDARSFFLKKYLDKTVNPCIQNLQDFQNAALAGIDTTDCFVTCASCFKSLGTKDNYVALGKGTEEEWDAKYEECKALCGYPKTTCEIALGQLLLDVAPNGQYGALSLSDPLSVFNPGNLLPKNIAGIPSGNAPFNVPNHILNGPVVALANPMAYWKKPIYYKNNSPQYLDKKGKRFKVILTLVPNGPNPGNYNYSVTNLNQVFPTGTGGVFYTYPENLTNLDDFIIFWQSSFSKSLVTYHPEFCYYKDCEDKFGKKAPGDTITSNDYDSKILFTNTFQGALLKGLLKPVPATQGYSLDLAMDPANAGGYFVPGLNGTPLMQKYNNYSIVNNATLKLHQFVAYTLKCGAQFGNNQVGNPNCINLGQPIAGSQAQITAMQDKEWNSLKAIYFGEKQKMLYEYSNAKRLQLGASCNYYNACIGDPNFDGYSTPMVKYVSPGNTLNQTSAYFNAMQPCNQAIKDLYVDKVKRFGPASNVELPDENEIAYQVFLQTGKCPMALDLQNLMHALAQNGQFASASQPLQNYPQMSVNFYNYINNATPPPTPYTSYLWKASIQGGNLLNVNFTKAINNLVVKFFQLSPPGGGINWANVQGVSQFMKTGNAGPNQTFSCTVQVLVGANTIYTTVTGTTNIQLDGCMFKDVCTPNDFAKQLQTVMSALKASGNFQTAVPFTLGAPGGNTFYGPYLQKVQQLIGQNANPPNFKWQYVANSSWSYELFDNSTPNCKLKINLLTLNNNPITGINLSFITSFKKIRSDYQNFFTMEARDVNNGLIGIIRGEVFKVCGGQAAPISMGTCDKPDPASCKTPFHKNRKDLEGLLKNILEVQKYLPVANANVSNVMNNVNLTNNLIGNFIPMAANIPATKYAITNNFFTVLSGVLTNINTVNNDSLAFTLKSPCVLPDPNPDPIEIQQVAPGGPIPNPGCNETEYCKIWLKTNNKNNVSAFAFSNITNVKKLVGRGNIVNNNFTDFYILVDYTNNNVVTGDTIFGSSCYELQNCNPCKDDINLCCGGNPVPPFQPIASPTQVDSMAVADEIAQADASLANYALYNTRINTLNSSNSWNPGDTSYITPIPLIELTTKGYLNILGSYNEFIDKFDSTLDNRMYLKNISLFAQKQGFCKNPMKAYERYVKATNKYNIKAVALLSNTLAPMADTTFYKNIYVDSINVYIDYLLASPVISVSTQSAPGFFAARAGLPPSNNPACEALYKAYVDAYLQFANNPINIQNCGARWLDAVPMYPYQLFIDYGYCCPPNYIEFNNYINSFYNNTPCPGPLTPLKNCTDKDPPSEDECTPWFNTYLIKLAAYNSSPWAINNNAYLNTNLFASISSFYQQGFCVCVNAYLSYLNQYIVALPGAIMSPPVSIKDWQGCGPGLGPNTCDETYNNYISATNTFLHWLNSNPIPGLMSLPITYEISQFTNNGLCYCAAGYIAFLNGIMSGAINNINYINENFSINSFCNQKSIACQNPNALDTVVSPPVPPSQNPCVKYKKDLAMANAAAAYQQYAQAQTTYFITKYNKHCLGATERLLRTYESKEFHFTLYYYDQAGNLIRTIPPEGLDVPHYQSIVAYNSPNEIKAKNDRTYKTKTLFTNHGMPTTYQYNSLNQLIKQKMPDHDALSYMKYKFNYGLDTTLSIVTSQFPDKNKGFLGGNETYTDPFIGTFTRGKVFESNDGSLSWKPVNNIAGTDLRKVQFVNAGGTNYGFAAGSDGAFLFSIDGGVNWDYLPLQEFTNGNSTLNDLYFYLKNPTTIEGIIVGDNGTVIKVSLNGAANITSFNIKQGNIPFNNPDDNITDITIDNANSPNYYITVLNKITNTSKIFTSNGNIGVPGYWQDISATKLPGLVKVRQLKNTSTFYAVGSDGNFLKSSDAGNTWVMKETNTALNFSDIYFATANDGVAILTDLSNIGSLYKTKDGGNNWSLLDQGNNLKNYKTLSPYKNLESNTIDKLTANGTLGLVKRITINYTTPLNVFFGAVTTNITTMQQINDVCVVPYFIVNNNDYKQLAIAVGNNGELDYCLDYMQNNPVWNNVPGYNFNFKKALYSIQNQNSNPFVDGLVLDNTGIIRTLGSGLLTNANPNIGVLQNLQQGGAGNNNAYADMVFDWSALNPYSKAYFVGKNNNSNLAQLANMPLQGVGVGSNTTPNLFTIAPPLNIINLNSIVADANLNAMISVGTNGEIINGTPNNNIGTNGAIQFNSSVNSSNVTPVQLNDITFNGGNVIVAGNDGYYAERPLGNNTIFQLKTSSTASDFNAIKFRGTFGITQIYYGVTKQGEADIIGSISGNNNLVNTITQVSNNSLNDVDVKTIGATQEAYFVGDNGDAWQASNTGIAQVSLPTSENMNSATYYPGNNNAVVVGNLTSSYDLSGLTSIVNRNWYTNQINKLHFTDANNGYFVGMHGLTRHTSDGGYTWRTVKPFLNPNNSNIPVDHYAVYTTAPDLAIIAGSHDYISNCANLTLSITPASFNNANANKNWNDIDLYDSDKGFIVGTQGINAKASELTLINNAVTGIPQAIVTNGNNIGFRSVYAFKGTQAGKFLAVGDNRTFKIYDGSTYPSINFSNQLVTNIFGQNTDIIYDLDFSDNSNGYLVGSRTRFIAIALNLIPAMPVANLTQQSIIFTIGSNAPQAPNFSNIQTVSLIDDANGFLGGNHSSGGSVYGKYAWKFNHEKGQTSTLFWYDKLGRMVLAQNTKQINKPVKAYSYTLYDALGRITEVGEKSENNIPGNTFDFIFGTNVGLYYNSNAIDDVKLNNWISANGQRIEVTHTFYDEPYFTLANCPLPVTFTQDNLRKRVASVTYEDVFDNNPCTYNHATHYSYDIHGNVKNLLQDNKALATPLNNPLASQRFKRTDYDYDLISGKVNMVSYQAGQADAFFHQYEYDDDNRITEVKTSRNGNVWESDAKYFYYKHGPLARVEYGHDKVQGMDYAYTLQGWIKGVNSNKLSSNNDMGKDGDGPAMQIANTNQNKLFAQDAMGYTLGYFANDYAAIDNTLWASANRFESVTAGSSLEANRNNLFNGNISHMATSIVQPLNLAGPLPTGYVFNPLPGANAYKYDQVNRIREAKYFENMNQGTNAWANTAPAIPNKYRNEFLYDDNGNITNQTKWDETGAALDNINYLYNTSGIVNGKLKQNRLYSVEETVGVTANTEDIETPGFNFNIAEATINTNNNYSYDEIGNLTKDNYEEISSIKWTVYGKIKEILRPLNSGKKNLRFDYDALGNRIAKHIYTSNNIWESSTYYVRDAQGNVMETYKSEMICLASCQTQNAIYGLSYKGVERNVYGSSRLGIDEHGVEMLGGVYNNQKYERIVGNKQFEMANHLGNNLTVISDRKIPVPDNTNIITHHFMPNIMNATDYYVFGQPMPGRQFNNGSYRYGFNGKESDTEVKGAGNQQDYGARIYDPRLGRFLSIDALFYKTPSRSPYNFADNNPIVKIDNGGNNAIGYIGTDGKLYIQFTYVAVTEGEQSFSDVERGQIENTLNTFWKTAKGMQVTLADGKVYEIGGVQATVIAGGDLFKSTTMLTGDKNFQNNLLIKSTPEEFKEIFEQENQPYSETVSGITIKNATSDTYNETHINTAVLDGKIQEKAKLDKEKTIRNTYVDESGHLIGTSHPKKGDDPNKFGALEKGEDFDGLLLLNQQDLQNAVKSKEFKLLPSAPPKKEK